tara:strand:+ start:408 stop:527 length:120 start_codon:yes stop_codon:yes gene_type:complete
MRVNITLKNSPTLAGALYALKVDALNGSKVLYGWSGRWG